MLGKLLVAWCLVAATVVVHAGGLALILGPILRSASHRRGGFWPVSWQLVRIAWWMIIVHLVEISIWALFYWRQGAMPDAESAFYFSGVTYSTVGYGDLVLPAEWRLLGPIEGLTGILMCGLSTGFFFAVVNRFYSGAGKINEMHPTEGL